MFFLKIHLTCAVNILYVVHGVFNATIHKFEQVTLQHIVSWLIVSPEAIRFRKEKTLFTQMYRINSSKSFGWALSNIVNHALL